jgi:hypothetical protein
LEKTSGHTKDEALARKLWDFSEELIIEKVGAEALPDVPV